MTYPELFALGFGLGFGVVGLLIALRFWVDDEDQE